MGAFSGWDDNVNDWIAQMKEFVFKRSYKYTALPENVGRDEVQRRAQVFGRRHRSAVKVTLGVLLVIAGAWFFLGLK